MPFCAFGYIIWDFNAAFYLWVNVFLMYTSQYFIIIYRNERALTYKTFIIRSTYDHNIIFILKLSKNILIYFLLKITHIKNLSIEYT